MITKRTSGTMNALLSGRIARHIMVASLLLLSPLAIAQEDPPPVGGLTEDPLQPAVDTSQFLLVETPDRNVGADPWVERVDVLIAEIRRLDKQSVHADSLYLELDRVLHRRIYLINQWISDATSPLDNLPEQNQLPSDIVTIADLHGNIDSLYKARLRLRNYLSPNLFLEVGATDVLGVQQLSLEFDYIWEQFNFRALNLPAALQDILRRAQIAPLPFIWQIILFVLVIAIFRWWRSWFPETLLRMRASLAEIRPRSAPIMRRIRAIWYIDKLRKPLEWMLLAQVLFSMVDIPGLNFYFGIVAVIVRWILLGWLSVALLDALSARGDVGMTGTNARLRLRSLRLIAGWLVLLGLGLSLAEGLAGAATLHAWVWRLFQVLALPILLVLLSWWRAPIFSRLERESDRSDAVEDLLKRRTGLRSYVSAASGAVWLIADSLRRRIMRMFIQVGAEQAIGLSSSTPEPVPDTDQVVITPISDKQSAALLASTANYDRYARTERRNLVQRINTGLGGLVTVVGERGIGKSRFLDNLASALDDRIIRLNVDSGSFDELESGLKDALGNDSLSPRKVDKALEKLETRVIAVDNVHRLVRPIIDGHKELQRLNTFVESLEADVIWVFTVDCFAWQFIRRVNAEQSSSTEIIELPSWTEEQLTDLLNQQLDSAGIEPVFEGVQIPEEHLVTSMDSAEERSKASVFRMIWTLARGNPTVALAMWIDSLYVDDDGTVRVSTPGQQSSRDLESAVHNVLLVLRAIAQAEVITLEDIADNLRLPAGAVDSAIHFCLSRGWIVESKGRYRLSLDWFRTITRLLMRQNLLSR